MVSKFKRIACVGLTSVMVASFAVGNVLAVTGLNSGCAASVRYDSVSLEDVTGKVDLTGVAIQNFSGSVMSNSSSTSVNSVNGSHTLIVTLEEPSVIDSKDEYQTVSDYLATTKGANTLKSIESSQDKFLSALSKAGISYSLVNTYSTITNSVAIKTDTSNIDTIKGISSVQSIVMSSTYAYPEAVETTEDGATTNPSNVYATGIYDSSAYTDTYDGSKITVAILDTGLDYTHEAFNVMPEEVAMTKQDVADLMSSGEFDATRLSALKGDKITADDVYINAKVPFAYDYADSDADVYPSYSQHGTHVAGIVAGQADSYTDKDGNIAKDAQGNVLSFRGVAPNAQLVICKVFTDDFESKDLGGATTEDILAALEDCVRLNVDIINMSLGTSAGFSSISIDGDTEGAWMNDVYGKIKAAGINLICAASNDYSSGFGSVFGTNLASNPDSGTVGSPSTFDGAMSVASINGQLSRYIKVQTSSGSQPIYYLESSDANSVSYDFFKGITADGCTPDENGDYKFKYVVIPGVGQASDYTTSIKNQLADKSEGKVIAVIKRGTTTFQDKIDLAIRNGADAAIIYNNVAGTIRMSLGDLEDPIPTISVTKDAGDILTGAGKTGYIIVNDKFQSGPFMNDYSSWGATPDLKLKPDVTAHGGEITSTVSGGYDEMSGTSMASPNLAGFAALLRSYLKDKGYTGTELTALSNQLIMSTATTVYDEEGLPYSPRKQGSGLATLNNVFSTQAYLYTVETDPYAPEDGRPKLELGEDEEKNGVYTLKFYIKNYGTSSLSFNMESIFMTETLSSDGMSVAEAAYILDDIAPVWQVNGQANGGSLTLSAGESASISVTLTLSSSEKRYIDNSFENGMYVEGFIKLVSTTNGQCDLNLPFMGFYGDWEAAPMLDYNCYEIAEFEKDTSYTDETRPQAQIWATQAYSTYWNEQYTIPMGSYLYIQDENAEQIYVEEDHAAISRYNEYYGEDSTGNYMTAVGIKALYAGLLRNAELVTYTLSDAETGEIITEDCVYRLNKAYAGGGRAVPAQVLLEFNPDDYGLEGNGKYALDFHFYFKAEDAEDPDKQNDDNTFSMVFYLDYEAPVLVNSSIRYYDYKDGNKDKQKIYLDLEVYDNHYAQSVMLCYLKDDSDIDNPTIQLATEYVTPVLNATKNGTTTVSIDVTDIIDDYKDKLYIQVDDYALNHSVYSVSFSANNSNNLPDSFEIANDSRITVGDDGIKEITIGVNEAYKINLDYEGDANLSNFTWNASPARYVKVNNGEIFGCAVGTSTLTIKGNGELKKLKVHVVESNITLATPSISFGTIINSSDAIEKAQGSVKVNAGQTFTLEIITDPWYYPEDKLSVKWSSSNEKYVTVDQNGVVKTLDEKGTAIVKAVILDESGKETMYSATVILNVQEPFTVSGSTLSAYHGSGGDVKIPDDMNIMIIGEEAFKDNENITSIIIPKTVTQIEERAFKNCKNLEYVYFVQKDALEIADADLSLILRSAFEGCTKLKVVDLSNVKTITLDKYVFSGCTSLTEVKNMKAIGTMNEGAFYNCSSLISADITGLHMSGDRVFEYCTSLESVETDYYTALGNSMFYGCTSLESVTIKTPNVGAYAFAECYGLTQVNFESVKENQTFAIGYCAFINCVRLNKVDFNGNTVTSIEDQAFAGCSVLIDFNLEIEEVSLGNLVFENTPLDLGNVDGDALYDGTRLVLAPKNITSDFAIKAGTTEIAAYAFSGCKTTMDQPLVIPSTVSVIGEGAFANSQFKYVTLPEGLTEIHDYTFYGAEKLVEINIPASVKIIGESAFQGCGSLKTINFAGNSQLEEIGSSAFMDCYNLQTIVLPDGVSTMGDTTFLGCYSLVQATLPSLSKLGEFTFWSCYSLESVTFGENATTTGTFTFYPGATIDGSVIQSSLKNVTLGKGTRKIGDSAFTYCTQLESIDLTYVKEVGDRAFYNCTALGSVTGMENLEIIGDSAFYSCTALTELNLAKAREINDFAFFIGDNAAYTTVNLPVVEKIGDYAFFSGGETVINLPATLKEIGAGAFANSLSLTSINVDADNQIFFSEDGVLYRRITEKTYEICAYPSAKQTDEYAIKVGTVKVKACAFAYLLSYTVDGNVRRAINQVVIPYSVKVIGNSAFYNSGVSTYVFECINAPTLLSEYYDNSITGFNSLFYMNFEDEMLGHADLENVLGIESTPSTLTIHYPANGYGYDNYVFSKYFGTAVVTEELIDDTTRALKETIEGFVSAQTVSSWNSIENNAENKAMVTAFADSVKEAHRLLNNITDETQLTLLGAENIEKLTAIEKELKSVKTKFGISVSVVSLKVSPDSTHKSEYVEGEKFDMTGLLIIIVYDDYSTETADYTNFTLDSRYEDQLTSLDRYVIVTGYGKTVQVAVKVSEAGADNGDDQTNKNEGSFNPAVIYGPVIGVVALAGIALAVVLILKKRKAAAATGNTGSQGAETEQKNQTSETKNEEVNEVIDDEKIDE
ncbi:MAG: leucine-rich repeat protein [Candidatus Coproplasma sp.]